MTRRFLRPLSLLVLLAFVIYLLNNLRSRWQGPDQTPSPPYLGPDNTPDNPDESFLPLSEATTLCERRRLPPYYSRARRRKVFDLFLINTELDYLEIRLHELEDHVDYFVIIESPLTFQSSPKPLYLTNAIADGKFARWKDKIIHRVVNPADASPKPDPDDTWEQEHWTRNQLLTTLLSLIPADDTAPPSPAQPNQGDVLIISDVDELPSPFTITLLRNCAFPPRTTLRTSFYYYSYQWQHRGSQWHHPQATFFNGPAPPSSHNPKKSPQPLNTTILPEHLRNHPLDPDIEIWNAGWHCSSCFRTLEELKGKITSFAHKVYNDEYILDQEKLLGHVRMGEDIFEREGEVFDRVDGNGDVPDVLKRVGVQGGKEEVRKRFAFMLDRDGEKAGFEDV